MKKILLIMAIGLILCGNVFADNRLTVITAVTSDSAAGTILVGGTNVVYTKAIHMPSADDLDVWYKASGTGAVNVKIELERSYTSPTTEYVIDPNYLVSTNDVINAALIDKNARFGTVDTVYMPYVRFKCTGITGNHALTRLTIKVGAK